VIGGVLFATLRVFCSATWRSDELPAIDRTIAVADDEEMLFREALALVSRDTDPVVQRRLVRLARYLDLGDGDDARDATLASEARALRLELNDPVIRRYLVEMMRLALAYEAPRDAPTEREIEAYYEKYAARFAEPEKIRLTHVYLSDARRGPPAERDAAALLGDLHRDPLREVAAAAALGDPFVRGSQALGSSEQLDRIFGAGFGDALARLPERTWAGPVSSSYGFHVVWIDERIPARVPPLAMVRSRVMHSLLRERAEDRLRLRLTALRSRYRFEISGAPDGRR
jgi:hypothetical protein